MIAASFPLGSEKPCKFGSRPELVTSSTPLHARSRLRFPLPPPLPSLPQFACDYTLVADLLKRVSDSFREHRCLNGQRTVSVFGA